MLSSTGFRIAHVAAGACIVLSAFASNVNAQASLMVAIPAGAYRPLYARQGQPPVRVEAFLIDRRAVTRMQYQEFLHAHVEWTRRRVLPVFADRNYLSGWRSDSIAGDGRDLLEPVTEVSWFAASSYCAARNSRLPTVDEWEYVAAADSRHRDAARDPAVIQQLIGVYMAHGQRAPGAAASLPPNVYGVEGLHDAGWEWTQDFNSVLISDDSRSSGDGVLSSDHRAFCASAAIGATDPRNYPAFLRYAMRAALTGRTTSNTLGFRCASSSTGH